MQEITEEERIAKCREIAAFNGAQAAMLAASGNEVLARAWAVNAATAAFHVLGRDHEQPANSDTGAP